MMYLQSNNPNSYNTVEFISSISKEDKMVEYRVVSLSTTISFSITTETDFITIAINEKQSTIMFKDKGSYDIEDLNEILSNYDINAVLNDKGLLVLTSAFNFSIIAASHRVKVLFGFYHDQLPLTSHLDVSEYQGAYVLVSKSVPYFNASPILYLLSRTDAICLTNARCTEESQSIAFKTHELFVNGYPFSSTNNGNWFKIKSSQLQQLKFTLVDFMLEPIILHAPLYITVEVIDERMVNERFKQFVSVNRLESSNDGL